MLRTIPSYYYYRIHSRSPTLCTPLRQYSTKSVYSDFKKLRAFPFAMPPDKAQRYMAKVVAPLCATQNYLAHIWANFLSTKNSLRPLRFSAAYFPAWVVNAEIEADITDGDVQHKGTIIFRNSYIPGSHVPTLSAAPMWCLDLELRMPSAFSTEDGGVSPQLFDASMLRQYGEEVQCIPFTTSPFAVLGIARNLSWTNAIIDENLKFSPSSVKANLFSAHPVLLPLYLAVYEVKRSDGSTGTVTLWAQAHSDSPLIMTENFLGKVDEKKAQRFVRIQRLFCKTFSTNREVFPYLPPDRQVKVDVISFPASKRSSNPIEQWLEAALGSSANVAQLASTIEDDDDPRIRPMSKDELSSLEQYFKNESEVLLTMRILEDLREAGPGTKVITIGLGTKPRTSIVEAATATLQGQLEKLLADKARLKPQWWAEWEHTQKNSP